MSDLFAFLDGRRLGVFRQASDGVVFEYEDSAARAPVSLSMPRGSAHRPDAAYAYLDNLLPDRTEVRAQWARNRDLAGHDHFTLLAAYGEDVAGAVSLSPDPDLPDRAPEPVIEVTEEDVAARIASMTRESRSWQDPRTRPRMSLAGAQGKFTLTRIGDRWFWPTYGSPSTHILKPPSREHRNIERFEHASLELAREVGLSASTSQTSEFLGQPVFIVERWDRAQGGRIHAEDMNQALARRTEDKYDVGAPEVAVALREHGQADRFVRQLAFNASLGNADAHAKNYSVLFAFDQVRLAPIYDAVPTQFWPTYDKTYAMSVGEARRPVNLNERNWRLFAERSGLDGDAVCESAFEVMGAVAERYEGHFAAAGTDQARLAMIAKHVRLLRRAMPGDASGPSSVAATRAPAHRTGQTRGKTTSASNDGSFKTTERPEDPTVDLGDD